MKTKKIVATIVVAMLWMVVRVAWAHDPGLSAANLQLQDGVLDAALTFSPADVNALGGEAELQKLASVALVVKLDGHAIAPGSAKVSHPLTYDVQVVLKFEIVPARSLTVQSTLISKLARGHRQYFVLTDGHGKTLASSVLNATDNQLEVNLQETAIAPKPPTFTQFLLLGIEHILTGYDHLAFLFGLLIVGGSVRSVLKIITSFTLAHSITLALATLGVINFSPNITEPMIAVSIIYVGLENIFKRGLDSRWILAFGFGLIHGCGFATALKELGIGANGSGVVLPLLSFNLGVELGQITIAALILPIVWKLKPRQFYLPRLVPACSIIIAVLGSFWLVQRTLLN